MFSNLWLSLFGGPLGEKLRDWSVPPARVDTVAARWPLMPMETQATEEIWKRPPQNSRLVARITSDYTLYLPPEPSDGAQMAAANAGSTAAKVLTIHANGRTIEGSSSYAWTPASTTTRRWMYRADTGNWAVVSPITSGGTASPLPDEFDELFINGVGILLCGPYGISPPPGAVAQYGDMLERLKTRYAQDENAWGGWDPSMNTIQVGFGGSVDTTTLMR